MNKTAGLPDLSNLPRMTTQSFRRQAAAMRLTAGFDPRKDGKAPR